MVGLVNNDETAYREEVKDLAVWCQDNNLSLNVIKTKEMIVGYRKRRTEHVPILIDGAVVEQVESFKFLGDHITNKLTTKIWHGSSDPQKVLHLHHREHWLHHCLVWQLLSHRLQGDTKGRVNGQVLGPSFMPSRTCIIGDVRVRP